MNTRIVLGGTIFVLIVALGTGQLSLAREPGDGDTSRPAARLSESELRSFDAFLDSHSETADQLYRDPSLANNERFLRGHREFDDWITDHPETAKALRTDPKAILWRERGGGDRAERGPGRPVTEEDIRGFESYLDRDWEVADRLYKEPDLVNNRQFVQSHAALDGWFDAHPDAARAIRSNPHKFLWRDRQASPQAWLRGLLTK